MKQIIIGIFAHPDDAAFGPSGVLAMSARDGIDVHLICATCGDAGVNDIACKNLATRREHEERDAAKIMVVSSLKLLRYAYGQLCNNVYLEVASKVIAHIRRLCKDPSTKATLITFDQNGISGHIDHIFMSLVTTYAYMELRDSYDLELKYFCIPDHCIPTPNTDWLYMPAGRKKTEISETVDVHSVSAEKIAAIKAHKTQAKDGEFHIARGEDLFYEDFIRYHDK